MTVDLPIRSGVRRTPGPTTGRSGIAVVAGSMVAAVVLRLLFVGRPASPDEAGFLVVAGQWHVGGTSLYGDYWVDRPPLLIGIFRLADLAGGLTALRVIGALAAAVTVALLADTARRAFGTRAGGWAAVVAAALLISPLLGAETVDGELLAAPLIALGMRFAVEAVQSDDRLAARGSALGAGLAAVLALLVKQNMADVAVFAAVAWLVGWRTGRFTGRTCADLFALAAVGAGVGYAVVMLWAMAHGTSPLGVYQATYPFRLRAHDVMAAIPGDTADVRLDRLTLAALLSAAPVVLLAFGAFAGRLRRQAPVVCGILAGVGWAAVSIIAGGSYWLHYLIEAVPAVALAAGAVAVAAPRLVTWLVGSLVVVSTAVTLVASVPNAAPAPGNTVGRALAGSARPGDTVLSAFGDADIPRATGMTSPYPYLWSLPSRTLDPDMTLLRGILAGNEAPTWIVVRGPETMGRLASHGVAPLITSRYTVVRRVCGRSIYLLRGLDRPRLEVHGRCGGLRLP